MTLSQPEAIRDNWTLQVPGRRMAEPAELRGVNNLTSLLTGSEMLTLSFPLVVCVPGK